MTRPRVLDLFCKAGGCSAGYRRAGYEVVGVDIEPQPHYPFEFHQADAMIYPLEGFDLVHASPPCQDHSALASRTGGNGTGWMLAAIRDRLTAWGGPYVIENVIGAALIAPLMLCGSEFGLTAIDRDGTRVRLERHRLFESNRFLIGAGGCQHPRDVPVAGVYGGNSADRQTIKERNGTIRGGYVPTAPVRRSLMGIDWMTREELNQAVPPAYTEFIGSQLIEETQTPPTRNGSEAFA